jgi:2-methylcitrate dehydratase PrpD
VEVTIESGETFREHVVSVRGTPENPMTTEEVEKKALDLMASVLGEERSQELIGKIRNLESLPSVRDLRSLLKK